MKPPTVSFLQLPIRPWIHWSITARIHPLPNPFTDSSIRPSLKLYAIYCSHSSVKQPLLAPTVLSVPCPFITPSSCPSWHTYRLTLFFMYLKARTVGWKSAYIKRILPPAHRLRSSAVFLRPITNYESIPRLQAALDDSSATLSKISGPVQPSRQLQSLIIILSSE